MSASDSPYTGELRQKLDAHTRLLAEEANAGTAVLAAEDVLTVAREQRQGAAVAAKLDGKSAPSSTAVDEAVKALEAAKFDAEVAQRAAFASMDRVVDEAKQPEHDTALAEHEEKATHAALAAVATLEKLLGSVAEARGQRAWLKSPMRGNRIVAPDVGHIPIVRHGFTKPNGDSGDAKDLTDAIRGALRREAKRPEHETYGVPPGMHMVDAFGEPVPFVNESNTGTLSPVAAALFEQQATGIPDADESSEQ